jgi:hypothetical protein
VAAKVATMEAADRCELCGARAETTRDRIAHLRAEHPAYARGLLLRLMAPAVFLVGVLLAAAIKAPQWTYLVVLFASFGLLFFGKVRSRAERSRAGARPTLRVKQLVREGGLPFLLIIPIVMLLILLLSRR